MRKAIGGALFALLLLTTLATDLYHIGSFRPPQIDAATLAQTPPSGVWIGREKAGINQLILQGKAYHRGLESGRLVAPLLRRQENELTERLFRWISPWMLIALEPFGVAYFYGIEDHFEPSMLEEMYGVSKSAPKEFDRFGDGFTRQITYHGIHEIGQMIVDQKGDRMGCTLAAAPSEKGSWILGRNFDFEGGPTFDREKIMKWVFPDEGNAYVSVIWAGMVGAVTGVNERGIYVSMNAAGSDDFRRVATPSTLVLLKILERANTAEEALEILRQETMFITDIFVVLDSRGGKLYRVEKSPKRLEILPLNGPSLVANHLVGPAFRDDETNRFRRLELTSEARQVRGEALLRRAFPSGKASASDSEMRLLSVLRDKGEIEGKALALGNRNAIDPLISAHSVVFNGDEQTLYVSQGPGVSGAFLGFDLTASFRERRPVRRGSLPADPLVSEATFTAVHRLAHQIEVAEKAISKRDCVRAKELLSEARQTAERIPVRPYELATTEGDLAYCLGDGEEATRKWTEALALRPAYHSERAALTEKLENQKRKKE